MFGFWTPGPTEIVIILVIALLLFGKRLPEVGRSLGRGIVEFKKGVRGIEDEIEQNLSQPTTLPTPKTDIEKAGTDFQPVETVDTPNDPEKK